MSDPNKPPLDDHYYWDYEDPLGLGDAATLAHIDRHPPTAPPTELEVLTAARPKVESAVVINSFLEATAFEEHHPKLQVVKDVIGVVRRISQDTDESYHQKLQRERERSKRHESARYGIAHIMGEKAVVYAMDYPFFAGSLSEGSGEKYVRAQKHAREQRLHFVSLFDSSGARQQENTLALLQMQRLAYANGRFKAEHPELLLLSVLIANVWGGMSASAAPLADLVIALSGGNNGFSGPRVIENFQKSPVPAGAQSVEAGAIDRNVDVIVQDVNELVLFVGGLLKAAKHVKHEKMTALTKPAGLLLPNSASRDITFGPNGYAAALPQNQQVLETVTVTPRVITADAEDPLMAQYEAIASDGGRVDTEFIMRNAFDRHVPLYNHRIVGADKKYPAIIASFAWLGDQQFMVIGDQPSYVNRGSFVSKRPANPKPEDFDYQVRMMELAKNLKLPVIFLTDTLGAEPTIASEKRGQSRAIAQALRSAAMHKEPVITLITGALGSGGGLATGPFKDAVLMLDKALAFVSEPQSNASILYNTATPTAEQISLTLRTSKATADDHHVLELIDKIVPSGDGPYETVKNIREAILNSYIEIKDLSARQRRNRIKKRVGSRGLTDGE